MQLYDSTADVAGDASHHRLSQKLLARKGVLRALIEKWVDGTPLKSLPELAIGIAKLSNIPIVEREIEAVASQVTHGLRHGRSGVIEASLTMKMGSLRERLDNDPGYYHELMQLWPRVTNPSLVPQIFGFHNHPQVQALQSRSKAAGFDEWWSLLAKLIYHADLAAQFLRFEDAEADHAALAKEEAKTCKLQRDKLQIVLPKQALSEAVVIKRAFCRHVQASGNRHLISQANGNMNTSEQSLKSKYDPIKQSIPDKVQHFVMSRQHRRPIASMPNTLVHCRDCQRQSGRRLTSLLARSRTTMVELWLRTIYLTCRMMRLFSSALLMIVSVLAST